MKTPAHDAACLKTRPVGGLPPLDVNGQVCEEIISEKIASQNSSKIAKITSAVGLGQVGSGGQSCATQARNHCERQQSACAEQFARPFMAKSAGTGKKTTENEFGDIAIPTKADERSPCESRNGKSAENRRTATRQNLNATFRFTQQKAITR